MRGSRRRALLRVWRRDGHRPLAAAAVALALAARHEVLVDALAPSSLPCVVLRPPPVGNGWLKYRNKQQWVPDTEATTCASIGPNHPTFAGAPFNETTCADYKWHVPATPTPATPS